MIRFFARFVLPGLPILLCLALIYDVGGVRTAVVGFFVHSIVANAHHS